MDLEEEQLVAAWIPRRLLLDLHVIASREEISVSHVAGRILTNNMDRSDRLERLIQAIEDLTAILKRKNGNQDQGSGAHR